MMEPDTDHTPEFLAQYPKHYGPAYRAPVIPDYSRCAGYHGKDYGWGSKQCLRPCGHGPHGAWCKQHDPVARIPVPDDSGHVHRHAEAAVDARDREFTAAATKDNGGATADHLLRVDEVRIFEDGQPGVVLRGSVDAIRNATKLIGEQVTLLAARKGGAE